MVHVSFNAKDVLRYASSETPGALPAVLVRYTPANKETKDFDSAWQSRKNEAVILILIVVTSRSTL